MVGGGLAGSAVALALRERGLPVTLVERGAMASGATGRSGGMLAPQYEAFGPTPLFRLAVRAREEWPAFAARLESLAERPVGRRAGGMLVRARGNEEVETLRRAAEWQRSEGLAAELLPPPEAGALQPGLGNASAWLWLPSEEWVDARAVGAALEGALRRAGVELRTGRAAIGVREAGGAVAGVELEGGERFAADTVVVAAGAWSRRLEGLPRDVPVRPVRGQMIRYGSGAPGLSRLLADLDGRYLVPLADGTLLAGSTMEEAGFEEAVTEEGLARIRRAAGELAPGVTEARSLESWAGLRPMASDDLPIVGAEPDMPGLFWATAYGRNGILLAPLIGLLLAEWIAEGGAPPALDFLRPDRFAVTRSG